jgi:hypothetical protein
VRNGHFEPEIGDLLSVSLCDIGPDATSGLTGAYPEAAIPEPPHFAGTTSPGSQDLWCPSSILRERNTSLTRKLKKLHVEKKMHIASKTMTERTFQKD